MADKAGPRSRRVATSAHIEVSTYLDIAKKADEAAASVYQHGHDDRAASHETIVILDFGSQYSQLIARRVRESKVYCELVPFDAPRERIASLKPMGFILSGGPASVYAPNAPQIPAYVFEGGVPILGICYGMQLLAFQLGGRVAPSEKREYGHASLYKNDTGSPIFEGLSESIPVWMSHGDQIIEMPPGFSALAYTNNSPVAAMGNDRGIIGLQFHPEVAHTPQGKTILRNFLYEVCGCKGTWTAGNFVTESIERIQKQVGDGKVICALSGGVDSSVTATLIHRAIGEQLTCIFVNNGLLRRDEVERTLNQFHKNMQMKFVLVEATDRFLDRLAGIIDPEEKRKRIGEEFIRVFEDEALKLGRIDFLAQGTLYPDVIESTSRDTKASAKIKTHHNVGGLPENMRLRLVEPLRFLFKDEVREVGLALGLAEDMVFRQPFPGPGLAIRIIGEVTRERLETLRAADWIVVNEIKKAKLYHELWQSFAILTPLRSVGVMGDGRTYANVVAVRAVTSEDAMTADWARLPYDVLARISSRIVNEVPGVNRVVYDISSKPPSTIEWE
ncbi:MAG: glutamine-hydrolyzing GMP synthase [Dehalococcoidia bacterium]|nr:glutamine-hydrolyzing GMP synthase [Dehalococcoidia bacterium]